MTEETEVRYIPLTVNPDFVREHGTRIMRDEVSSLTYDLDADTLRSVSGLIAGITLVTLSVGQVPETAYLLEVLDVAVNKISDRIQLLDRQAWEREEDEDDDA